jgi:signal peptidase I
MSSDRKKTKKGTPAKQRSKGSAKKNDATGVKKQAPKSGQTSSSKKSSRKAAPAGYKFIRKFRIAFLLFIIISTACMVLFDVSEATSGAMMPAIHKGDLVLSWAPWFGSGDHPGGSIVMIGQDDNENAPNFLRVIGVPGNDISFNGDKIEVNGESLTRIALTSEAIARPTDEPLYWRETLPNGVQYRIMLPRQGIAGPVSGKTHVHDNEFFAVGDNRTASYDSRQAGNYPADRVKGQVLFVLKSMENDGILGHWLKWVK